MCSLVATTKLQWLKDRIVCSWIVYTPLGFCYCPITDTKKKKKSVQQSLHRYSFTYYFMSEFQSR